LDLIRYEGTVLGNMYGPGTGDIWLDDVQCMSTETSIAYCFHKDWGDHDCGHHEDVSVRCGTSPVQYGNSSLCVGRYCWFQNSLLTSPMTSYICPETNKIYVMCLVMPYYYFYSL